MDSVNRNIKPDNPEKLVQKFNEKAKMLDEYPVFDFKIYGGNIYITRYYDKEHRREVGIPSWVCGFENEIHWEFNTGAFTSCEYLEKIIGTSPLHGSMEKLFYSYMGKTLELENFDTRYITNMREMFKDSGKIQKFSLGDKFDTRNVTTMREMFAYFGLEHGVQLDIGDNFDTKKVTDMRGMFKLCGKDRMGILDIRNKFNTEKVLDMRNMFGELIETKVYRNGKQVDLDIFLQTYGKRQ